MTTYILNIQEIIDVQEMELQTWQELAVNDGRKGLERPHGNVATDGMRIHAADLSYECECGNAEIHNKVNDVLDKTERNSRFIFMIDRQYLLDALAGLEDGPLLLFCGSPKEPVVIREYNSNRSAVIMPMDATEVDTKLSLPRVIETANAPTPDSPKGVLFS